MDMHISHRISVIVVAVALMLLGGNSSPLHAQDATQHQHDHSAEPSLNYLSEDARNALRVLMVQDFQGRMKPFDTLASESAWKTTKRGRFDGWNPIDLYVTIMAKPSYWFERPLIAVRHKGLREFLGLAPGTKHISPASLYDESQQYRLAQDVEAAHRTPDKAKTKVQRKLLSLDERFNLFHMTVRGLTFKVFPIPGDEDNRWISPGEIDREIQGPVRDEYQAAFGQLYEGLQHMDNDEIRKGAGAIRAIQSKYGAEVLPSKRAMAAELQLNKLQPFVWASVPYLIAFVVLIAAYGWSLLRFPGRRFSFKHPLYAFGMAIYIGTLLFHTYGYVIRWIASGRAPLSNGYESLIFISVMIGVAGLFYEVRSRRASMAGLSALLTSVMLGVAMLPTFDAAITPLVPVLQSAWLIIHVTVITASYGYFGLAAVVSMTMLVMYTFKGPGRMNLRLAIFELNGLLFKVLVTGLAFLSVGTFLGGVWANESWGRYWGWDPKETWSLVTIVVYAFVIHFRYIPKLNNPLNLATGGFLSILSVGMTYFGVNYFLSGLHSYAQGDAPGVPGWVYGMVTGMIVLVLLAYWVDGLKSWEGPARAAPDRTPARPAKGHV